MVIKIHAGINNDQYSGGVWWESFDDADQAADWLASRPDTCSSIRWEGEGLLEWDVFAKPATPEEIEDLQDETSPGGYFVADKDGVPFLCRTVYWDFEDLDAYRAVGEAFDRIVKVS